MRSMNPVNTQDKRKLHVEFSVLIAIKYTNLYFSECAFHWIEPKLTSTGTVCRALSPVLEESCHTCPAALNVLLQSECTLLCQVNRLFYWQMMRIILPWVLILMLHKFILFSHELLEINANSPWNLYPLLTFNPWQCSPVFLRQYPPAISLITCLISRSSQLLWQFSIGQFGDTGEYWPFFLETLYSPNFLSNPIFNHFFGPFF